MKADDRLQEKLRLYLDKRMTPDERKAFQSEVDSDIELKEFVSAYLQIETLASETEWPMALDSQTLHNTAKKFRSPNTEAFHTKLKEANARYSRSETASSKPIRRKIVALTSVAAVLLLILYMTLPSGLTPEEVYGQYSSWTELPSLAVKGSLSEAQKTELERTFRNGNYEKALQISENLLKTPDFVNPNLLLYYGISQLETERYFDALTTFNRLTESNTLDAHKGLWYKALVYLKKGDIEAAQRTLETVAANEHNFRYAEARKILKRLK